MNKKFGALSSSIDPDQLSATVSGAILTASSIIIVLAHSIFGITIVPDAITQFAQQAGITIGFLWMVFGLVRKLVVYIHQRFFA